MTVRKLPGKTRVRWSEVRIARMVRAGRGQGAGSSYKSWIAFRELSSRGTTSRIYSYKLGRTVLCFSNIERNAFLYAEFQSNFADHWENFPLPRKETIDAASSLKFKHPVYARTKVPCVMTVDAVTTFFEGSEVRRLAVDCKNFSALKNKRTQEKISIQRRACKSIGLEHQLMTERTVPKQVVKNIQWIRICLPKTHEQNDLADHPERLLQAIAADLDSTDASLTTYCREYDKHHKLLPGLALRCIKLLVWRDALRFDLSVASPWSIPVKALTLNIAALNVR